MRRYLGACDPRVGDIVKTCLQSIRLFKHAAHEPRWLPKTPHQFGLGSGHTLLQTGGRHAHETLRQPLVGNRGQCNDLLEIRPFAFPLHRVLRLAFTTGHRGFKFEKKNRGYQIIYGAICCGSEGFSAILSVTRRTRCFLVPPIPSPWQTEGVRKVCA